MIDFKSDREKTEWAELANENTRLMHLVCALSDFTSMEFNKGITITSIFRTPEEHRELYKDTPVDKRPASSPHMRWEALDIRSTTFTPKEIEKMLTFLNCFTYQGGQRNVALYHTIAGNQWHFHIQYK